MEATGGVVVTQKDQTATGDRGDFDMPTNTVTLSGNVVVTKGQDVLRGQKLVVNMTTGVSRIEGGRVDALINSTGVGQRQEVIAASRVRRGRNDRAAPRCATGSHA